MPHSKNGGRYVQHSEPRGTQTVGRAALLLRLVASSRSRGLRLVDIAALASLDKSTAHRLLKRLTFERLLSYSRMHGYRLGPLLSELGLAAIPETNIRERSREALSTLALRTGDAVFLVQRSGLETVCMSRITGHFPIQTMTRSVGDRHPIGIGAGGLAILAALQDDDIEMITEAIRPRLLRYETTVEALLDAVTTTRERGGLVIDAGRAARDVTALGRVVPSTINPPSTAVFVASLHNRMAGDRRKQVERALVECVEAVSRT